jgi:hypothetical protein
LVTDSVFLDLAITGSLGLAERNRKPREPKVHQKQLKSPENFLVLLNRRSGVPLVVCAMKALVAKDEPPLVRFYSTKPRSLSHKPVTTTSSLGLDWSDSLPLYTWAEVVTEGSYPEKTRYSIYLINAYDGYFEDTPSYRAVHKSAGSPEIFVVGRTGRESTHAGCAILRACRDDVAVEGETFLHLSVSKGIDPALLICFAAFVDEVMEKAIQLQCKY